VHLARVDPPHPLVRTAKALARLKSLGRDLGTLQQTIVDC
jgi:hypothetical protein